MGDYDHTQRDLSSPSNSDVKPSSDSYYPSSDNAAMESNPSSDSYFYSSKIKGKGFDPFSAMGWLTDGCPGERTSEQKEHLYKVCLVPGLSACVRARVLFFPAAVFAGRDAWRLFSVWSARHAFANVNS